MAEQPVRPPQSPLQQIGAVLHKDLLIEWRTRAQVMALACFALTLLLLFSFAVGPDITTMRRHAAAYLWMSVLLSSTLLLARSFHIEVESGAIETLVLLPASPVALFYGKALANTAQLVFLCALALPAVIALYDASLAEGPLPLIPITALGCAGMAAPGTLYAGLTARLSARQLLLPLLLFPLIVPCLLGAVKATSLVMAGDPMSQIGAWTTLLVCFDLLYWSLCGALFGRVLST